MPETFIEPEAPVFVCGTKNDQTCRATTKPTESYSILIHNVKTTSTAPQPPSAYIPRLLTSPTQIQSRLAHLLKHWPSDPVRPASVSVHSYLQSHVSRLSGSPAQPQSQAQAQSNARISESSVNALTSLLENRYVRHYPFPQKLRRPGSNRDHYDNVIREFEEAPKRDWWGRLTKRLSGLLRFK